MSDNNTIILDGTPDAPILLFRRESSIAASDLSAVLSSLSRGDNSHSSGLIVALDCDARDWQISMLVGEPLVLIDTQRCNVVLRLESFQWALALQRLQQYTFRPGSYVWLDETTNLSLLLSTDGQW